MDCQLTLIMKLLLFQSRNRDSFGLDRTHTDAFCGRIPVSISQSRFFWFGPMHRFSVWSRITDRFNLAIEILLVWTDHPTEDGKNWIVFQSRNRDSFGLDPSGTQSRIWTQTVCFNLAIEILLVWTSMLCGVAACGYRFQSRNRDSFGLDWTG